MDLTDSYSDVVPDPIRVRYSWLETRNAAAIVEATNNRQWCDLLAVLDDFKLVPDDLLSPGGNESALAARLNRAFRSRGWHEARVDTRVSLVLKLRSYGDEGKLEPVETETFNEGYQVDNVQGRIALDVEWNAKDGNLDRDIGAYRALYDVGLIDAAVIITREGQRLRTFARKLAQEHGWSEESAKRILSTTTTTNTDKLRPRLTRGDAGGCPLLVVAIGEETLAGD